MIQIVRVIAIARQAQRFTSCHLQAAPSMPTPSMANAVSRSFCQFFGMVVSSICLHVFDAAAQRPDVRRGIAQRGTIAGLARYGDDGADLEARFIEIQATAFFQ